MEHWEQWLMNILFLDTKMLEKKTKYTNKLQMLATEMQTNHIKNKKRYKKQLNHCKNTKNMFKRKTNKETKTQLKLRTDK